MLVTPRYDRDEWQARLGTMAPSIKVQQLRAVGQHEWAWLLAQGSQVSRNLPKGEQNWEQVNVPLQADKQVMCEILKEKKSSNLLHSCTSPSTQICYRWLFTLATPLGIFPFLPPVEAQWVRDTAQVRDLLTVNLILILPQWV